MPTNYDYIDLPPERIELNSRVWERNMYITDAFQWSREMDEDEYSWNKHEIDIIGSDEPMRMVTLQLFDEAWQIQGCETGGPKYHRAGFCEVISNEYTATVMSVDSAYDSVMDIIERLS